MTRDQLIAELTATPRRQRLSLIIILAPFYLAFTLGGLTRTPIALFIGAIGLTVIVTAYRRYAPTLPPRGPRNYTPAGDGE